MFLLMYLFKKKVHVEVNIPTPAVQGVIFKPIRKA